MKLKYLTVQQLIEINKQVVLQVGGTNHGVQSVESLHVVIEQPAQIVFGHELYPTIWLKAAFILQKITKKHVFVDGNKRTALMASLYFVNQNGYQLINNKIVNQAATLFFQLPIRLTTKKPCSKLPTGYKKFIKKARAAKKPLKLINISVPKLLK